MMKKNRSLAMFIAASLDGYIARQDESLDWLFKVEGKGDNGYSAFYDTVDTILLGKRTYDWIMEHENGNFPYKDKECYVFSRSEHQDNEYVKFINGDVADFTDKLKKKDGKRIWLVGGGEIIHSFLQEKLVDEIIITMAPVLIGKGIHLFKELDFDLELSLIGMQQFGQFAELHYTVKK
jgi:dihydrofolate reductase